MVFLTSVSRLQTLPSPVRHGKIGKEAKVNKLKLALQHHNIPGSDELLSVVEPSKLRSRRN